MHVKIVLPNVVVIVLATAWVLQVVLLHAKVVPVIVLVLAISHVVVHHQQMNAMVVVQHVCMNAPNVLERVPVLPKDSYPYQKHVMHALHLVVLLVVITVLEHVSVDVANHVLDVKVRVIIHVSTVVPVLVKTAASRTALVHALILQHVTLRLLHVQDAMLLVLVTV